jgi:hypothetical protein
MAHVRMTLVAVALGAITSLTASQTPMPAGPTCIAPTRGSGCLPLAPSNRRLDLVKPSFSNPTSITNPLHPSSVIQQVIYGGQVDGKPFRTEFTRLPVTKAIEWDGQRINVVTWQYLAFSNGRIDEVAIDWFAQADDGAVWYFGEDVFNYANGVVADTEGTWIAGKNGPPGMIMPGRPSVGDVYRPENIPSIVFEEVTVKAVGRTVAGPSGPLSGALVVSELHMDGTREDKTFAPGYGEYSTGSASRNLEQAVLAVPTDARPGPTPAALVALSAAVRHAYDAVGRGNWTEASTALGALARAWDADEVRAEPELLRKQMGRDIGALEAAVVSRKPGEARHAALRVVQNDLDLRERYESLAAVERARVNLWARQIVVDAAAKDVGSVAGDVATLEWTWQRVRHTVTADAAARVDSQLGELRRSIDARNLDAASATASRLLAMLAAQ